MPEFHLPLPPFLLIPSLALAACAGTPPAADPGAAAERLRASEEAFARSMADRDFAAFSAFVADEAVFIDDGKPLRGKAAVLQSWRPLFDAPAAPFSWKPAMAQVSGSGELGYTEGPVVSSTGALVATFSSTWRRQADGSWRVVFDRGHAVCKDRN
jgi:ketosteroid isomerase-like protein